MTNCSNYIRITTMEHSRVKKFKEYRDSFTKVGAESLSDSRRRISDLSATTKTLPINEVIHEVDNREETERIEKQIKKRRMLNIVFGSLIIALLIIDS